jgi:hypothetical protein
LSTVFPAAETYADTVPRLAAASAIRVAADESSPEARITAMLAMTTPARASAPTRIGVLDLMTAILLKRRHRRLGRT